MHNFAKVAMIVWTALCGFFFIAGTSYYAIRPPVDIMGHPSLGPSIVILAMISFGIWAVPMIVLSVIMLATRPVQYR